MTVINTANSAPCGNYSSTAVSSSKHFGKTLGMHVFMAFGGRPDGRQCLIFESHRYMCSRVLAITMGCKGGAKQDGGTWAGEEAVFALVRSWGMISHPLCILVVEWLVESWEAKAKTELSVKWQHMVAYLAEKWHNSYYSQMVHFVCLLMRMSITMSNSLINCSRSDSVPLRPFT